MTYKSEEEFSKDVIKFFQKKLAQNSKLSRIKVAAKVQILKDFTIGRQNGAWKPILGVQQQDIVFYRDALEWDDFGKTAHITNKGTVKAVIPLLISEIKIDKNMVTHAFIVYSSIAQHIKEIFPHCVYYFILNSNKKRNVLPETVLRQSKGFDRVFLEWSEDRETIWKDIHRHLSYLKRTGIL